MASYADAGSGVRVDLTLGTRQDTGGGGLDTLRSIEGVRGSAHGDTFAFSRPEAGATYTVEGGGGDDAIDLSAFGKGQVRLAGDARSLEVALPGGGSFRIEVAGVSRAVLADGEIDLDAARAAAEAPPPAPPQGVPAAAGVEAPGAGASLPELDEIREHLGVEPPAGGPSPEGPGVFAGLEVHDPAAHLPPGVEVAGDAGPGAFGFERPAEDLSAAPEADPFDALYELESEEPAPALPGHAASGARPWIPEGIPGSFDDHFELEVADLPEGEHAAGADPAAGREAAAEVAVAGSGSFLARLLALVRSSVRPGERSDAPAKEEKPGRELPSL